MAHRLDIAAGKNEFDRQLGNFRVQIRRDDEGEPIAKITANVLAPRRLSEHQRANSIITSVDMSAPAPDALRLAVLILREAKRMGLSLPSGISIHSLQPT
jgi:hypothetical protein